MKQPTVVLIHGLFGFTRLLWLEYFRVARPLYASMGMRVLVPSLPPVATIRERAAVLARQLADEAGPLHLVAHSMGGLDARYWISCLGGGMKVASLTTLATPHHGSPVADHVCTSLSPFRLLKGPHALTTSAMQQFNDTTPDDPAVIYRSYAAVRPLAELPWLVRRYARMIQQHEGDNDSQVSGTSACWGELAGCVPADHFELISLNLWFNPFTSRSVYDPLPLYREIGEWVLEQEKQAHAG
ncbi:alpha/beta fold hydrolase [Mariprofundus erugo]|uniref:Alpha/beta fold hydrolase n=1 Tax=Mariprofundus erugo TaxID=2528639 RepID=A0A5R9GT18_9PROT|nr:alpha/beta fold hydrolase [Mariprofundus erugo]TLS67242.1 alpha/beta fold hydrolase [Mariprofundus erugo]TLS76498.1 alpha/beta fold hydrolase [Mariprofundus erugo]